MPIKIVTDSVGLINLAIAILGLAALAYAFVGLLKKNTLEVYKATNEALEKRDVEKNKRLEALESSQRIQEMRIWKAEFESERRGLLLNNTREEVRILEKGVRAAFRFFAGLPPGTHQMHFDEVKNALQELEEFRHKSASDMDAWELTKSETMSFINDRTIAAENKANKK